MQQLRTEYIPRFNLPTIDTGMVNRAQAQGIQESSNQAQLFGSMADRASRIQAQNISNQINLARQAMQESKFAMEMNDALIESKIKMQKLEDQQKEKEGYALASDKFRAMKQDYAEFMAANPMSYFPEPEAPYINGWNRFKEQLSLTQDVQNYIKRNAEIAASEAKLRQDILATTTEARSRLAKRGVINPTQDQVGYEVKNINDEQEALKSEALKGGAIKYKMSPSGAIESYEVSPQSAGSNAIEEYAAKMGIKDESSSKKADKKELSDAQDKLDEANATISQMERNKPADLLKFDDNYIKALASRDAAQVKLTRLSGKPTERAKPTEIAKPTERAKLPPWSYRMAATWAQSVLSSKNSSEEDRKKAMQIVQYLTSKLPIQ